MQIECENSPISMLDLSISCLQNDFVQVVFLSHCIRLIVMSYVHNKFTNCLLNDKSYFIWFDWSQSRSISFHRCCTHRCMYHSLIRYLHSSGNNYRTKNSTYSTCNVWILCDITFWNWNHQLNYEEWYILDFFFFKW